MSRILGGGAFHAFVILKADCLICAACSYLHIAVLIGCINGDIYIIPSFLSPLLTTCRMVAGYHSVTIW